MSYSHKGKAAATSRRLSSGKMAKGNGAAPPPDVAQMLRQTQMQEMMVQAAQQQMRSIGNVIAALFQNMAPTVDMAVNVLVSFLGATIVNNGLDEAMIMEGLRKAILTQRAHKEDQEIRAQDAAQKITEAAAPAAPAQLELKLVEPVPPTT